jgi:hypothetical protein
MGREPRDGSRIYIAGPRRHDQSLGRGETHSGVDRAATRCGSHRGAAAQMANHQSQRTLGALQYRCSTSR